MSSALEPRSGPKAAIDVLVVDDSSVVRTMILGWLTEVPWVGSTSAAADGHEAIRIVQRAAPNVILLDIDMPGVDGLWLIPRLVRHAPGAAIIVCSGMAREGGLLALECVERGAKDIIAKPSGRERGWNAAGFRDELVARIQALAGIADTGPPVAKKPPSPAKQRTGPAAGPPGIVVVGASTGGPQALQELLGGLLPVLDQLPVVIAQHVPVRFARVLADHFRRRLHRSVSVAIEGDVLQPGRILLAPGGCDLRIAPTGGRHVVRLGAQQSDAVAAPSVDILFQSAAACFGKSTVGVILSGMGSDGLTGARLIRRAGGRVFAQDRLSSAVWGMPGAVADAGIATIVADPVQIAARIAALAAGELTRVA